MKSVSSPTTSYRPSDDQNDSDRYQKECENAMKSVSSPATSYRPCDDQNDCDGDQKRM